MKIFRSYDIRGIVGKDLNEKIAEKIGLSFGTYLQGFEDVIVGMDMRKSSEKLKKSLVNGIVKTGCNVIDIGMTTTPMVAFSITYLEKNAGVSVTASHNPSNWNGFKLKGKNAVNLTYDRELKKVENIFLSKEFLKSKHHGIVMKKDIRKIYSDKIYSKIIFGRKLKVVLDIGNGMGGIAESIYRDLGCDVISLFREPDGNFPNHIPNPAEKENLRFLQRAVIKYKADIGIALDADCDRVGVVDNRGRIVRNDILFEIFAQHILEKQKGNVVCDIRTPSNVIEFLKSFGIDPVISRAGSGYIMKKSMNEDAVFAGEMSGHFWFGNEWYHIDDGIYSGAKIIEILSNSKKMLAKIVDEMPKNYIMSKRIKCPERKKAKIIEKLKKFFERTNEIIEIDGIKITSDDHSILIRPSRTEPQLEIVIESKKNNLAKIYQKIEESIKSLT